MNVVSQSRARSTGATVLLVDNRDESFELMGDLLAEGRWATVCETHGNYCLHGTRALAVSFVAVPEEWCAECGDHTDGSEWVA